MINNFQVVYNKTDQGFVPQITIDEQIRNVPLIVSEKDILNIDKKIQQLTKEIDKREAYSVIVGAMILSMKAGQ